MPQESDSAERPTALAVLESWLQRRLTADAKGWLEEKKSTALLEDRNAYLAFALAPRKVGKADLQLTDDEFEEALAACPGWTPRGWTTDQAARLILLLAGPADCFGRRLTQLCATGDIGEQVALYQALPIYPDPAGLTARAAEGLRTNIIPVFEAVAHANPYPRTYFDEAAWNQMVLKALFIGSSLHPIQGIDDRANASLANTMIDYAHERWAAGRPVSPELWRCVGPFLDDECLADLERAWNSPEPMAREAAALALAASDLPAAKTLLASDPQLAKGIDSGAVSWSLVHETITVG